ncbi:MAG: YicC family protein [Planctomycetes bacterium]|nr:YicC family protein [Planctomycetota bacterium]
MINSMTGFGRLCREIDGTSYVVEIKTVNNRYFKVSTRLPETAAFLEDEIEKLLRENIYRGTVNYNLRYKSITGESMLDIDTNALAGMLNQLNNVSLPQKSGGGQLKVDIGALLSLPGIVRAVEPDEEQSRKIRNAVLEVTIQVIESVKKMRAVEGAHLVADLRNNCRQIERNLAEISSRASAVVKGYQDKLKNRIDTLLESAQVEIDRDSLAKEVAFFADRCDIAEETIRLSSHLEQFLSICENEDRAGRKLDFLSQEMLREANTIASKASDAEIAHYVVEIKSRIDRIKEQVQNIE